MWKTYYVHKKTQHLTFYGRPQFNIPDPFPIKSVLMERFKHSNTLEQSTFNEIAQQHGHPVLRFPP